MSTQANITVLDINDNSPRFTSPEVFYSWTNDTVIGNVQATDDDSGGGELKLLSSRAKLVGVCSLASRSSISTVPLMKVPFFFLLGEVT